VNCLYLIREFRIGFDDILIILQNQVQNTEGVFVKKTVPLMIWNSFCHQFASTIEKNWKEWGWISDRG